MRVQVTPERVELTDDNAVEVFVTVHNTGSLIGGYHLRVLGADPSWVSMETESLSLFPDTSETVTAMVRIPPGVAAGERRIAVQVRELTPPQAIAIAEIELVVPPSEALRLTLTPMTVIAGKTGTYGVIAENLGNTTIEAVLAGSDAEDVMKFEFVPPVLTLAPGDQTIADLRASGPRRWFGSPVVRAFGIGLRPEPEQQEDGSGEPPAPPFAPGSEPTPTQAELPESALPKSALPESLLGKATLPKSGIAPPKAPAPGLPAAGLPAAGPPAPGLPTPAPPALPAFSASAIKLPSLSKTGAAQPVGKPFASDDPLATGTLLQKPRLSRGALSLLSLLVAATVFATVITIAFSALVGQSSADRDLAIQVAAARNSTAVTGTSTLGGTIVLVTSGEPAAGVTVEAFAASATTTPVDQTATGDDGKWSISNLPSGSYKLRFNGAGFVEIWYPAALSASDATEITVQVGQQISDLQVNLGGLPATVSGQVVGTDVAGAVLTVQVPLELLPGAPPADPATPTATADGATPPGSDAPGAVLKSVPIGSDGAFEISDIPSPKVYDLVVSKPGFATEQQRVDLAAGETRTEVQLRLRTGDGLISGMVTGPDGPLGGAVITATTGTTTVETVSLTEGDVGAFTVRGLVTPANYTLTVNSPGFSPQTSTLSLSDGQKLTGVQMSLARSSGSLSGTVTTIPGGAPAAGVAVKVTSGSTSVDTVTQSAGTVGGWTVTGLPIPATYTVTFSRADLQSQTVAVTLDPAGNLSSGSAGAGVSGNNIAVAMTSAFAEISGVVTQRSPDGSSQPVGEAALTLTSGTNTYTMTSASQPADAVGSYRVGGVKPGTYTLSASRRGTTPTTVMVTVVAGQALTVNPVLIPPASIVGTVRDRSGVTLGGLEVLLYKASVYPAESAQETTTDAQGRYSFADVDAPQAYVVEVRSTTLGPLGSSTLVLAASEAAVLDITVGQSAVPATPTVVVTVNPAPPAVTSAAEESTTDTAPGSGP